MDTLLTGATGFVGQHILWRLLNDPAETGTVCCLVRGTSSEDSQRRLDALLDHPAAPSLDTSARARCRLVWGDVTAPGLGLDDDRVPPVGRVIHCAATVKFNEPLERARAVNVEGTRNVLAVAERLHARGVLRRVDYVGTAFVAGRAEGLVREDALVEGVAFHNSYERTKWEAEDLVRRRQCNLPITIYRPSIVVGDSRSGYTANFRVLYKPLKLVARGVIVAAPADPRGVLDIVPVDYVIDALLALSGTSDSIGRCYHLAAGPEGQSSIADLLTLAAEYFEVRRPLLLPPQLWAPVLQGLLHVLYVTRWGDRGRTEIDRMASYFPYFRYRASFDTTVAREALAAHGISPPSVRDYFRTIMRFCTDTNWGRNPAWPGPVARHG
jgi:nucleoside-diphosphate-sugar epimerase